MTKRRCPLQRGQGPRHDFSSLNLKAFTSNPNSANFAGAAFIAMSFAARGGVTSVLLLPRFPRPVRHLQRLLALAAGVPGRDFYRLLSQRRVDAMAVFTRTHAAGVQVPHVPAMVAIQVL